MRCLWVSLLLIGCGRFGFGETGPDPDDAAGGALAAIEVVPPAFSTTSAEFVDIPGATLTIPPSPGTTWLLVTTAGLGSTTTDQPITAEARYVVDGIERGIGGVQTTGGLGPWQHFCVLDGGAATQTVVYQLRDASAGTATIDQLHAIALPLPAGADPRYASRDGVQPVTSTVPAPLASLSLGALSGDYIVLAVANASDAPGLADVYVEWRGPGGEVLLAESQQPREHWQSLFAMSVLPVAADDAVITLNAWVGGGTSQLRDIRALALRADAFASIDHQLATMPIDTQAATPAIANELFVAESAAPTYVYLASAQVEEACPGALDAARGVHFLVDTDDRPVTHLTDNCATQNTYGAAGLLATRPMRLAIGVSSGNGEHVILGGSQLLLLGLP